MKKIEWDDLIKSETFQGLSTDLKRILTHLYLKDRLLEKELIYDFIALYEGGITLEKFKRKSRVRVIKNKEEKS